MKQDLWGTIMANNRILHSCDFSPDATNELYNPIAIPPFFDVAEAKMRHQVFLHQRFRIVGGICISDPSEYDSDLQRILSFHEKSTIHLANGALLGPYVVHLGGHQPVAFRGLRFFMPNPSFNRYGDYNE